MVSFFNPGTPRFNVALLLESIKRCQSVESGILRLGDFGLARNRLILLYLEVPLIGSNSVGRMPASNAGPASSHCPERTRDPNQFPSKVDATTPDRPTAVVRSDELETNQSRLRARADAGQLKRAWLAARNPGTVRCPAQQLVRQATMFCLHPTSRWMSIDIEKQARPSMRSQGSGCKLPTQLPTHECTFGT